MDASVLPIAILAASLFAVSNFLDKFLISKVARRGDYRGLVIVSSLIAGIILIPMSLVLTGGNVAADLYSISIIFLSAVSYIIATIFYYKALYKNDTSLVIAMFNLTPVFGYFLGLVFLDEILLPHQIIGGIIIIIASAALSYEPSKGRFARHHLKSLALICLSASFFAIYHLLFRLTTITNDFNGMAFWYQISLVLIGILLFAFAKRYRKSFIKLLTGNGISVFFFNVINEGINLGGVLLVNFAMTLAPMAIVESLNGFQPIFAFILGFILSTILPKIFKEDRRRHILIQRAICILVSFIGLVILHL